MIFIKLFKVRGFKFSVYKFTAMATIRRFEDMEIWQLSRMLCNVVFTYVKFDEFSRDYKLVNQVNSSSGSVMDNIAEGFDRGGRKEFVHFLGIAKGSAGDVKSQLYRALDRKYISEKDFQAGYKLADEINRKIHGLISYLNSSETKGQKFKNRVEEPNTAYGALEFDQEDKLRTCKL
jgi:four helix bundle protein